MYLEKLQILLILKLMLMLTLVKTDNDVKEDEMLSISNTSHVICAFSDGETPIFPAPPVVSHSQSKHDVIPSDSDGWQLKDLQEIFKKPILDKRWEEFGTQYIKTLSHKIQKYLAISVYNSPSPNKLEFFVDDDETMENIDVILEENTYWTHFHLVLENNNMYFYKNNERLSMVTNFQPTKFFLRAEEPTYVKVHDSKLWYSETISTAPLPVPWEYDCFVLYVALCPKCSLRANTVTISGQNQNIDEWQVKKISLNSDEKYITLDRLKQDQNQNEGENDYWAIDIRRCPRTENDRVIYEAYDHNEIRDEDRKERKCFPLKDQQNFVRKRRSVEEKFANCPPGNLGKGCSLTCNQLLGKDKWYCEKHFICDNGECLCAWGFTGDFCEKKCDTGYWGLDCRNTCRINGCSNCNGFTGECDNSDYSHNNPNAESHPTPDALKTQVDVSFKAPPKNNEKSNFWVIPSVILICMVVVLSIIVAFVFVKRSKKIADDTKYFEEEAHLEQQLVTAENLNNIPK